MVFYMCAQFGDFSVRLYSLGKYRNHTKHCHQDSMGILAKIATSSFNVQLLPREDTITHENHLLSTQNFANCLQFLSNTYRASTNIRHALLTHHQASNHHAKTSKLVDINANTIDSTVYSLGTHPRLTSMPTP